MTNQVRNHWLVKFLLGLEAKYYQQILLPELLIVLRLDPEIAVQRKQEEPEFSVRARSTEIWEFDWKTTAAHVIDANQSKEAVLSEIKCLVWSEL
jgi:thymidylate kinase